MRRRVQLDQARIGIYLLRTPTNKFYVGMTCDSFDRRWSGHLKELRRGVQKTRGLKNAYAKYGWDAIEKVILEEWEKPQTIEELESIEKYILKRERYWWEQLASDGALMLHGCPTGTGSVIHSPATRKILARRANERTREKQKSQPLKYKKCTQCNKEFLPSRRVIVVCSEICKEMSRVQMPNKILFTKPLLEKLYLNQKMSTAQIAQKFDCSQPAILYQLKKFDIPRRNNSAVGYRRKEIVDK